MDAYFLPALVLALGISMAAWQWAIRSGKPRTEPTVVRLIAEMTADVSRLQRRVDQAEATITRMEQEHIQ